MSRGKLNFDKKLLSESLADFNKAYEINAKAFTAFDYRGEIHRQLGNLALALVDLNRAYTLDTEDPFTLAVRGDVHRLQGNLALALIDFNEAIRLGPRDSFVLNGRGDVHLRQNNYAAALTDFNDALNLDAEDHRALASRGLLFLRQNNLPAALTDLQRARELKPKSLFALRGLGDYYQQVALSDLQPGESLDTKQRQNDLLKALRYYQEANEELSDSSTLSKEVAIYEREASISTDPKRCIELQKKIILTQYKAYQFRLKERKVNDLPSLAEMSKWAFFNQNKPLVLEERHINAVTIAAMKEFKRKSLNAPAEPTTGINPTC